MSVESDDFDDEEPDLDLPSYVAFDSIAWMIPHPMEGGQGAFARAAGFSRRSVTRWKRAGRIRMDSADRAAVNIGEHPAMFWPEAFGLPAPDEKKPLILPRAIKAECKPVTAPVARTSRRREYEPALRHLPPGAIDNASTRALLALQGGASSVRQIAETTDASLAGTHDRLRRLRDLGLVSWKEGRAGTLRALVRAHSLRRQP